MRTEQNASCKVRSRIEVNNWLWLRKAHGLERELTLIENKLRVTVVVVVAAPGEIPVALRAPSISLGPRRGHSFLCIET